MSKCKCQRRDCPEKHEDDGAEAARCSVCRHAGHGRNVFCEVKELGRVCNCRGDSGKREQHATGAVRDSAVGKGRPDLISPFMLQQLAAHLEQGAQKYEERNWEKGIPLCRSYASLTRHAWLWFLGYTDENHMAAVICNAMFIIHTTEMIRRKRLPASLDDRPEYNPLAEGKPDSLDGKPYYGILCKQCSHEPHDGWCGEASCVCGRLDEP